MDDAARGVSGGARGLVSRVRASYWDFSASMRRLLDDRPSDAVLISFLMVAALVSFIGSAIELFAIVGPEARAATAFRAAASEALIAAPSETVLGAAAWLATAGAAAGAEMEVLFQAPEVMAVVQSQLGALFVGRLIIMPLGLYLLSALALTAARAAGGGGDWYETRAAFIWAFVVATPLLFAGELLQAGAVTLFGVDAGSWLLAAGEGGLASVGAAAHAAALALQMVALFVLAACIAAAHKFKSVASVLFAIVAPIIAVSLLVRLVA